MKKILISLSIITASALSIAQTQQTPSGNQSNGTETISIGIIPKGRIFTMDNQKTNVFNISIGDKTIRYQTSRNGQYTETPIEKILQVDKYNGNRALLLGVVFGASGCLGALLAEVQAKSETSGLGTNSSINKIAVPLTIGMTVICAGIGALIGKGSKKYKTVYNHPTVGSNFMQNLKFDISFRDNSKTIGVKYDF